MDFDNNKPIYLQIGEGICERVLSGDLRAEDRIPSVREFGADIGVNPNTVMRTYERLTADGIIYNKRGIGYFISPEAREIILENEKKNFLENELPAIRRRMRLLGIDPALLRDQN